MEKELWEKCAAFHGHECGGLTIGYKAALYAIKLLELDAEKAGKGCFSTDEELVCICENDACGVDAIQVILGCSIGKGNLLFHITGKQAFSFYLIKRHEIGQRHPQYNGYHGHAEGQLKRVEQCAFIILL